MDKISGAKLPVMIICALLALSLSGCDAVVDCIDGDGPALDTSGLQPATLNKEYLHTIRASVRNEPFDDRFEYDFAIIGGALPAGISGIESGRSFTLTGTPTELGEFTFRLNVFVDDGQNAFDSGLCFRNEDRNFTLLVNQ